MGKRKKIAAVLFIVTILFFILGSALFIAAEVDHDCVGEGCTICHQISICRNTLKNLSIAVSAAAFAAAFTDIPCRGSFARTDCAQSDTPVSLKVKLTN